MGEYKYSLHSVLNFVTEWSVQSDESKLVLRDYNVN